MCMYLDKKATTAFRKKIREAGGTITCWKVYKRYGTGLASPVQFAPAVAGDIVSNRVGRPPGHDGTDHRGVTGTLQINRGIHVYRTKHDARSGCYPGEAVVSVRCQLKDCVGAGDWGDAVFTKVHLSNRSYAAALKGA